jgi:endonuclease YncB( thermonuclease family)
MVRIVPCFFQGCVGVIAAEVITGVVTLVSDGDTIVVETGEGTKLRCRLAYIDAPEIPHGRAPGNLSERSEERTVGKNLRKTVTVRSRDRSLPPDGAVIYLDTRNINLEMVSGRALPRPYTEYIANPAIRLQYINTERHARSEKIGIWSLNGMKGRRTPGKGCRLRDVRSGHDTVRGKPRRSGRRRFVWLWTVAFLPFSTLSQ